MGGDMGGGGGGGGRRRNWFGVEGWRGYWGIEGGGKQMYYFLLCQARGPCSFSQCTHDVVGVLPAGGLWYALPSNQRIHTQRPGSKEHTCVTTWRLQGMRVT